VGSLAFPQLPRLPASRCALGLSRARFFHFMQRGCMAFKKTRRPSWGLSLERVPQHVFRRRVNF
jgi:hypothetical protein